VLLEGPHLQQPACSCLFQLPGHATSSSCLFLHGHVLPAVDRSSSSGAVMGGMEGISVGAIVDGGWTIKSEIHKIGAQCMMLNGSKHGEVTAVEGAVVPGRGCVHSGAHCQSSKTLPGTPESMHQGVPRLTKASSDAINDWGAFDRTALTRSRARSSSSARSSTSKDASSSDGHKPIKSFCMSACNLLAERLQAVTCSCCTYAVSAPQDSSLLHLTCHRHCLQLYIIDASTVGGDRVAHGRAALTCIHAAMSARGNGTLVKPMQGACTGCSMHQCCK
jgi:hypothetical protein